MLASDIGVGPNKRNQSGCVACGGCEGGRRELMRCKAAPAQKASVSEKTPEDTVKAPEDADGKKAPARKKSAVKPAPGKAPTGGERPSLEALRGWKVLALRSFVRKLPGFPLKAPEIRYANKAQLMTALEEYYERH